MRNDPSNDENPEETLGLIQNFVKYNLARYAMSLPLRKQQFDILFQKFQKAYTDKESDREKLPLMLFHYFKSNITAFHPEYLQPQLELEEMKMHDPEIEQALINANIHDEYSEEYSLNLQQLEMIEKQKECIATEERFYNAVIEYTVSCKEETVHQIENIVAPFFAGLSSPEPGF